MSDEWATSISHDGEARGRAQAAYRRVGLICGAAVGLGLALGAWGPDIVARLDVPLPGQLPGIALGVLSLVAIGALAGRLSTQIDRAVVDTLLWLIAAVVAFLIVSRLPYEGRTWLTWLADDRLAGLPVFPYDGFGHGRAAFFLGIFFFVLGITQAFRLEVLRGSLGLRGRLSVHTVFLLVLHVAFAFGVGLIADDAVNCRSDTTPARPTWRGSARSSPASLPPTAGDARYV